MSTGDAIASMGAEEREAYVISALAMIGLSLPESDLREVVRNIGTLQHHAAIVMRHPLDDETEIAPVFIA
ncbi:MAG: DUF4089 domain-containing protein [Novosphingobium sp.]